MATVTIYLKDGQGSDDAANLGTIGFPYDEDNGFYALASATAPDRVGIRYAGINVPQGSTINSAFLWTRAWSSGFGTQSCDIWGVDTDDAETWADTTNEPKDATKTSESINFFLDGEFPPQIFTLTVTDIVQEIINREGWSSGNGMAFVTNHNHVEGRFDNMGIEAFEDFVGEPYEIWIKLVINYTPPSEGTNTQINIEDDWKAIVLYKLQIGDNWKAVVKMLENIGDDWKVVF